MNDVVTAKLLRLLKELAEVESNAEFRKILRDLGQFDYGDSLDGAINEANENQV